MKWEQGRQGSGYLKKLLFESKRLRCDIWLLKFPAGVRVPTHRDPVNTGLAHHRINIVLRGSLSVGQRMYVLGPHRRFWRFIYLRPDQVDHGLPAQQQPLLMLSFGWCIPYRK